MLRGGFLSICTVLYGDNRCSRRFTTHAALGTVSRLFRSVMVQRGIRHTDGLWLMCRFHNLFQLSFRIYCKISGQLHVTRRWELRRAIVGRKADRQGFKQFQAFKRNDTCMSEKVVVRLSEEGTIQYSTEGERQEVVPPMLKFRHGICRGFGRRDAVSVSQSRS